MAPHCPSNFQKRASLTELSLNISGNTTVKLFPSEHITASPLKVGSIFVSAGRTAGRSKPHLKLSPQIKNQDDIPIICNLPLPAKVPSSSRYCLGYFPLKCSPETFLKLQPLTHGHSLIIQRVQCPLMDPPLTANTTTEADAHGRLSLHSAQLRDNRQQRPPDFLNGSENRCLASQIEFIVSSWGWGGGWRVGVDLSQRHCIKPQ